MESLKEKVAHQLKKILEDKNLSQTDFANRVGLSKDTVSKLINGKILLSISNALLISDKFDVSLDYLFGKSDERNADEYALKILLKHFKFSSGLTVFARPVLEAYIAVSPSFAELIDSLTNLKKAAIQDDLREEGERRAKETFLSVISEDTTNPDEEFVLINRKFYTNKVAASVAEVIESNPQAFY